MSGKSPRGWRGVSLGIAVGAGHPFATGRLARWGVFNAFLEKIVARGDVWFAPMEEIAQHALNEMQQGRWIPQTEKLPQYAQPAGRVLKGHLPRRTSSGMA